MFRAHPGRRGRGGRSRPHRARPARLGLVAALVGVAALVAPATAGSADPSVPASGAMQAVERKGPPTWLPLRQDLDGGPIKVGCTYQSRGSSFGYSCGGHHGRWALDLLATSGTPIYAAGPGFATNLTGRRGGSGYGNVVQVDHGSGIVSLYAHMSDVMVPPAGAWVDETTQIGTVGSTGSSSAPHLHYEVRNLLTGQAVDPGPLAACWLGVRIAYPNARGRATWQGLQWGEITVQSQGTDCAVPKPTATEVPRTARKGARPGSPAATRAKGSDPREVWLRLADAAGEGLRRDLVRRLTP